MKLIYIANIRLPTEKAHGVHIMLMCQAFAQSGVKVELIVPWRFNPIKTDPYIFYSAKRIFKIRRLFSIDLIPLGSIGFFIHEKIFGFSTSLYLFWTRLFGGANETRVIYI